MAISRQVRTRGKHGMATSSYDLQLVVLTSLTAPGYAPDTGPPSLGVTTDQLRTKRKD